MDHRTFGFAFLAACAAFGQTSPTPPAVHALSGRILIAGRPPANPIPVALECAGAEGSTAPRHSKLALTDESGRYEALLAAIPPATPGETGKARFNGCKVSIHIPGFQPYQADLAGLIRSAGKSPVELRRIGEGSGTTVSPTGRLAPKRARDHYAQSLLALAEGRTDECIRRLEAAISQYPQYAAAKFALADIRDGQGFHEMARAGYMAATAADPTYVMPRIRLGWMAAEAKDWPAAARFAAEVIALCPNQFPDVYLLRGTAEFKLGNLAAAEQFAKAGLAAKGDPEPQLQALLSAVAKRSGPLTVNP